MKFIICLTFLINIVFAQTVFEKDMPAVVRTPHNFAQIELVTLPNLVDVNKFEGLHFKIVKGKLNEAISFDDTDEELKIRAATTYYHLEKARSYFVDVMKSEYTKNLPQITVRIEHTNQFNELGHFANDNLDPQYNNALTIPAGRGLPGRNIAPWGIEIWFRPVKEINVKDLNVRDESSSFDQVLQAFRSQTHMSTLQRFLVQLFNGSLSHMTLSYDSIFRLVGSSVLIEAGNYLYDPLKKVLSRKWYRLDTALVPEIIYHEFAHVALSDHLVLSHSTAVIEGMADLFAGVIADSPKLALRIKKYNTFNGKNAKRKKDFALEFETTDYANTDFVFGLLWEMKNLFGDEKGVEFIYALREHVTTNSTIRGELIQGILDTCKTNCANPFVDKITILEKLNLRGI